MVSTTSHIRTVLDVGPLTIDYIRNSKGKHAYKFHARQMKYATPAQLNRIVITLRTELKRIGEYEPAPRDRAKEQQYYFRNRERLLEYKKEWQKVNRDRTRAANKRYYQKNKAKITAEKRAKYALEHSKE